MFESIIFKWYREKNRVSDVWCNVKFWGKIEKGGFWRGILKDRVEQRLGVVCLRDWHMIHHQLLLLFDLSLSQKEKKEKIFLPDKCKSIHSKPKKVLSTLVFPWIFLNSLGV